MSKIIKSIKGLFGQIIHYEGGKYAGESWSGLFKGSYNHYDADGKYIGYSDRSMIADLAHYNEHGDYVGKTYTGLLGEREHCSAEYGYAGETWDGLIGETSITSAPSGT